MPKTLILLFCLISSSSYSQINFNSKQDSTILVGEARNFGILSASLKYKETPDGRLYMILYQNALYNQITDLKSVTFFATEDDIDQLYRLFKELIKQEKGTKRNIEIGTGKMSINVEKTMGIATLMVVINAEDTGIMELNKSDIEELFGKKKK